MYSSPSPSTVPLWKSSCSTSRVYRNIFFERSSLLQSGGFDASFCKSGERWTYGDETLPQMRLKQHFPAGKFFYEPQLSILHLVRPDRLNIVRSGRECFAMGRSYVKLTGIGAKDTRIFPYAWRFCRSYLRFWFRALIVSWFRDRQCYRYFQNYVYESTFEDLRASGIFFQSMIAARAFKQKHGKNR